MATSISAIAAGLMDATDINSRITLIQAWINGGMVAGDLAADSWAGAEHVIGPEIFGTPAPMARMTFGDVHWRVRTQDFSKAYHQHPEFRAADGDNWIPVDGLNGTVDLDEVSDIKVTATYWAWTLNGENKPSGTREPDTDLVARFKLARYNETGDSLTSNANTVRKLYGSGTETAGPINSRIASKQFYQSQYMLNVPVGVHHIGVRCKLTDTSTTHYRNLMVVARNLTIKIFPKA